MKYKKLCVPWTLQCVWILEREGRGGEVNEGNGGEGNWGEGKCIYLIWILSERKGRLTICVMFELERGGEEKWKLLLL